MRWRRDALCLNGILNGSRRNRPSANRPKGFPPAPCTNARFRGTAPGHRPLITEVFFADDPWLETDAVFGVRPSLVKRPVAREHHDTLDLDFRLAPESRA